MKQIIVLRHGDLKQKTQETTSSTTMIQKGEKKKKKKKKKKKSPGSHNHRSREENVIQYEVFRFLNSCILQMKNVTLASERYTNDFFF